MVLYTDWNGDQKLDLAVANTGTSTLSILLGNGTGGFGMPITITVGNGPSSLVAGDWNADGKPDLAVANSLGNDISVLLGNGAGGFATPTTYVVGISPSSMGAGDFNNDNKPDLVVASQDGVSMLLGSGLGTFATPARLETSGTPTAVAIAEVNGDNQQDLAIISAGSDTVSVLRGNGHGGFAMADKFYVGPGAAAVSSGILHGGGIQDLVIANPTASALTLLFGDGSGCFATSKYNVLLDTSVGDFDRDGLRDIAVLDDTGAISFYGYSSTGCMVDKFTKVKPSDTGIVKPATGSLLAGDVDGDGIDDVVVVTPSGSAVITGRASNTPIVLQTAANLGPVQGRDAALADMNGDGWTDLVRVGNSINVHFNAGKGGMPFASGSNIQVATAASAVRVADMNGDGKPDVIALSPFGEVLVLTSNGATLNAEKRISIGGGCLDTFAGLAVADFDDNGLLDVVVNGTSAILFNPLNKLNLQYIDGVSICYPLGSAALAASDLNSDGSTDLAWLLSDRMILLPSGGHGLVHGQDRVSVQVQSVGVQLAPMVGPRHVPAIDMNSDGTSDLILGNVILFVLPQ